MKDRKHYASLSADELRQKLRQVRDRMTRASTTEAALADMFTEQEIEAALQEKESANV